ncbi:DUF4209 domain-containing protein [Actinosynnema pretiosum]|uniref:DUF4209 domain-containing protein n=2 Tax=Pseudonocardiaceae TaxID=2070 RepID=UPI0020A3B6E4|nr:DUF4209 domain-containing protein [Actinosynnema pretiosum]
MNAESGGSLAIEHVARLVDQAASGADDVPDVHDALETALAEFIVAERAAADQPSPALWTIWAFAFHLKSNEKNEERFVPFMTFSDGHSTSPFLENLPEACVQWWADLVEVVTSDFAIARLQHLLVERRHGNVGDRARRAAEAYLGLAVAPDIGAVTTVKTAVDLAARTGQTKLVEAAIDRAADLGAQALAQDRPWLGIVLGFIDVLVDRKATVHDVEGMLARARTLFRDHPHQEDKVVQVQLARAKGDPDTRRQLCTERVELWLAAGEAADPPARVMYLQQAVEHARAAGDRELVERATVRLQSMRLQSMGFATFSAEVARPTGRLERMLRPITDAADWRDALKHFAILGPPTGDVQWNQRNRAEAARQFVFSQLFDPVLLGSDHLPRFKATTPEERTEYHLVRHELHNLQMYSPVVLEALVRVIARHPIPTVDELTEHFCANPVIPLELGAGIGRAFARFWAGDSEGAAFTITPRIEALARNLLITCDEGIYRIQREQTPGQYPGLRFLLDKLLDRGLDPSWHRFILVLCAHVMGMNLRNELAHGFVDHCDDGLTALLLQAAAYLASLGASPRPGPSAGPGVPQADPETDPPE